MTIQTRPARVGEGTYFRLVDVTPKTPIERLAEARAKIDRLKRKHDVELAAAYRERDEILAELRNER